MSHEEMGKRLNISRPAIHQRVSKLEQNNIIKGYSTEINWSKAGQVIKVLKYLPGSSERTELEAELSHLKSSFLDIPIIIGGREIRTGNKGQCIIPHDNKKVIG